ncbi:MAG: tetratricopeptide repeat protein, partial [Anaerolineae bacterium]|nr:tetratricopeptide repeat protein [Anaerolineae bacterium]
MSSDSSSSPSSEYIAGLRAALAATPNNMALRLLLAKTLTEAALFDQAVIEYQSASTTDPQSFEAAFGLGKTLLQLNRAKDAKPVLAQAVRLNEGHAEAHLLYAQALSAAGDSAKPSSNQGYRRQDTHS